MPNKTQLAVGGASAATASAAVGTGVVLGTGGKGEKIEVEDFNETLDKEDQSEETIKEPSEKKEDVRKEVKPKEKSNKKVNSKFPGKPAALTEIKNHNEDVFLVETKDYSVKTLALGQGNQEKLVSAKDTRNNWWWDLSFDEKFTKFKQTKPEVELHEVFKKVEKSFEEITEPDKTEQSPKALNQACHQSYKKTVVPFYQEKGLYSQTKIFCTIGPEGQSISTPDVDKPNSEPLFIKNVNTHAETYKDKLGLWGSNEDMFVSGTKSENLNWWIWKYDKSFFYAGDPKKLDNLFLKVWKPYSENKEEGGEGNQIGLNQACEEAYLKTEEIKDDKLQKNIQRYCTKEGGEEVMFTVKPDGK